MRSQVRILTGPSPAGYPRMASWEPSTAGPGRRRRPEVFGCRPGDVAGVVRQQAPHEIPLHLPEPLVGLRGILFAVPLLRRALPLRHLILRLHGARRHPEPVYLADWPKGTPPRVGAGAPGYPVSPGAPSRCISSYSCISWAPNIRACRCCPAPGASWR